MGLRTATAAAPASVAAMTGADSARSPDRPEARTATSSDDRDIDRNSASPASSAISGRIA